MKKKIIVLILLFGLIALFENKVYCQSITITGGNVLLNISTATAGQEPDPVTDESTGLTYSGPTLSSTEYKITVTTNLGPPLHHTLKVKAISLSNGATGYAGDAQGEVTLSIDDKILIINITKGGIILPLFPHTCTLKYTASATVAKGTGTDFHTITYTITQQ